MRIAILAIPGVQMIDVAGPMDVFHEANRLVGDPTAYEIHVVGLTKDRMQAANGMWFLPDACINSDLGEIDTLLVAGSPAIRKYEDDQGLIDWLRHYSAKVRRLGSVCTGAFLLAHAGLLDGRRATTHWNSTTRLAEMFPKVKLDADRIYVRDERIYTTAGVTASMDLALALVEEDYGRSTSLKIAKELILFLTRPGGQSQFSMQLAAQVSESGPIGEAQDWVLGNLAKDLSVESMANRAGMSVRNFARLFKQATGMTPGDYVEAARVEAARRILEEGDTSLKMVAGVCGFGDHAGLRRAFMRRLKVTPAEYRQTFRPSTPIEKMGGETLPA
jgi:transcriptional regulator GlxA family with amidase domain